MTQIKCHCEIRNTNDMLNDTIIEDAGGYSYLAAVMGFVGQYVDLDYSIWLSRLLTPLAVVFLLPGIIVFLLYFNSLFLYVYKWHR